MSDRSIVVGFRSVVAVGTLLAVTGSVISIAFDGVGYWWDSYSALASMVAVFFGAFVWVVIAREPRNLAVWTMASSALCGVYVAGYALAPLLTSAAPASLLYPRYLPAEQPLDVALLMMVSGPAVDVGIFVPLTFGLLLFPDGSLPSRRWRPVVVFTAAAVTSATLLEVWSYRPSNGSPPENDAAWNMAFLTVFLAAAAGVVALVVRFRSSTGETRQQFKWVMWGAAVSVPIVIVAILGYGVLLTDDQSAGLVTAAVGLLIVCYGIAVARYRLYDVDLVISRSIVYGSLASFITGIYVVVVVGTGQAFGDSDQPNAVLAITATALVAVVFQPARGRLQRMADRLVYGRRATAHDVLSEFSRRVAANDDALLGLVVRSLVEGTGAERASLWVTVDGRLSKTREWPEGIDGPSGDVTGVPIRQDGVELGALQLSAPGGQRLSPQDEQLASQVAAGLGLALRNRVLTETLQGRVDELRRSRQRLVALQDETRRRLERNLHDGAQQHLVALKVKLGLARAVAGKAGATGTADALARLISAADVVVETMRDFARGVHPPLLEAEGLGPAITAEARRAPFPVTVSEDGIGRYERQIETTVNRCVVEALQNVSKHAGATAARIVLAQESGSVCFEVSDDGEGFDPTSTDRGDGLTNMSDRLDAMAGTLTVRSAPGVGTTIAGEIPLDAQVRA